MKLSTAGPALTRSMTRRGRFNMRHNSSIEWAPTMDFPFISTIDKMRERTLCFIGQEVVDFGNGPVECRNGEALERGLAGG